MGLYPEEKIGTTSYSFKQSEPELGQAISKNLIVTVSYEGKIKITKCFSTSFLKIGLWSNFTVGCLQ